MPSVIIFRTKMGKHFTEEDYIKSSKREADVAKEISKISKGKLNVEFQGYGAGSSEKFLTDETYGDDRDLDLLVRTDKNVVAFIDVMGSDRWGFNRSGFFPVITHKVNRAKRLLIPVYFVFVLDLENEPNKWWIKAAECDGYTKRLLNTIYGPQWNYLTAKHAWNRGLQSLVSALLTLGGG